MFLEIFNRLAVYTMTYYHWVSYTMIIHLLCSFTKEMNLTDHTVDVLQTLLVNSLKKLERKVGVMGGMSTTY